MPSMTGEDVFNDPHLRERQFWLNLPHPELCESTRMNMPWKLSRTPAVLERSSPLMGEHNAFVLGALLGLSTDEIIALEKEGICY